MVHFPVRMDNGDYKLFKGYRVQHNNACGPYKGGIRYHPDVHLDDVKTLALLMTMKTALTPPALRRRQGRREVRPAQAQPRRARARDPPVLHRDLSAIGPDYDIPAPDVNTNAQTMAWFADTYEAQSDHRNSWDAMRVVTGKPVEIGGSLGREKATGQGVVDVCAELLPELGIQIKGMKFSVLGYGQRGLLDRPHLPRHGRQARRGPRPYRRHPQRPRGSTPTPSLTTSRRTAGSAASAPARVRSPAWAPARSTPTSSTRPRLMSSFPQPLNR